MATVNFSVSEDIKTRFNQTFDGCNKSAIVAELMEEAIERAARQQRSQAAVTRLLKRREHAPEIDTTTLQALREADRS